MSDDLKITRSGFLVTAEISGGCIESRSINTLLLYEILQELKMLNSNVIDVENAVEKSHR